MPGTADFAPTSSNLFFDQLAEVIAQIEVIGNRRVTDSASRDRALAEVRKLVADAQRDLNRWTGEDLSEDFRNAYKNGTPTPLTSAASSMSTSHRKRLRNNGVAALNDVQQWAERRTDLSLARGDLTRVRKFVKQGKRELEGGGLSPKQKELLKKQVSEAEKLEKSIGKRAERAVGDQPAVMYRRRRKIGDSARGTVAGPRNATDHFSMLAQTGHRDIINNAYIAGEKARGTKWVLVSDGPDCGWESHRSGDRANGKIVKIDEVIPYAHPQCQRGFIASGGPGTKRAKDLLAALTGAKDNKTLTTFVKSAAILGTVANVGLVVSQNPLVREVIRGILADAEIALGETSKKILTRWVNVYERTEAAVITGKGQEVNELSRNALRTQTLRDVEGKIIKQGMDGNDLTRISISRNEALVLNLKQTSVLRGELNRRLDDYADYLRHQTDISQPGLKSVSAAAQDETVREVVFGEQLSSALSTWMGRGSKIISNARRIHDIAETAYRRSPERAELELIDTLARVVDPLPWLRAHLGPFRFSVGMPSDARASLARSLWKDMRGYEFRLKAEPTYAWRTYTPLRDRTISAQDIYDNLTPRITYFGRPWHATIGLENGKLVPVFKLYPDQTFLNIFSFSAKVRSQKIADILAEAKELPEGEWPQFLKRQFRELGSEPFFTIDAFRNGPMSFTARWAGSELDALAVKFRPWDNTINYTHQLWRNVDSLVPRRNHAITLLPKLDGGYALNAVVKETWRMKVVTGYILARGSIFEVANAMGLNITQFMKDVDDWLVNMGMGIDVLWDYAKKNAHKIRLELDDVGEKLHAKLIAITDDFMRTVRRSPSSGLAKPQLRVVDDVVEDVEMGDPPILHSGYQRLSKAAEQRMLDDNVSLAIKNAMAENPVLDQDIRAYMAWWHEHPEFRGYHDDPPYFVTTTWAKKNLYMKNYNSGVEAAWIETYLQKDAYLAVTGDAPVRRYIMIPPRKLAKWDDSDIITNAMDLGWFNPRSAAENLTHLAHETGHHWSMATGTTFREIANFFEATFRHPSVINSWRHEPPDLRIMAEHLGHLPSRRAMELIEDWMEEPGMRRQLSKAVSEYGASDARELIAELYGEVLTSSFPSRLALLGRDYFRSRR